MKRRIGTFVFILVLMILNLTINVSAEDYDEGTCGDSLTWVYKNGTLIISGEGEMNGSTNWNKSVVNVIIEDGVTSIKNSAFYYCNKLTSVELPNSLVSIGDSAFAGCSSLENINIPPNVTSLGKSAFTACNSLINVSIPNSVTIINSALFADCSLIKSISIPNSVQLIDINAFLNCTNLESVLIPDSVTKINSQAFDNCTNLKSIIFWGDCPNISTYKTFSNVTATVYYPLCNDTWTENKLGGYGGTLTWEPVLTSHKYIDSEVVPPTCAEQGYTLHTCVCGDGAYKDTFVDALPHTFDIWTVTKMPTCTKKGTASRSCYCGAEEILPIAELGHDMVPHEAQAPTCTEIGWDAYETCSRCEHSTYVEIPAVGHKSVIDAAVDATCSETGLTEGSHCSVCSEVITAQETVPTTEHSFSEEWTVDKSPTKTENGSKSRHCANCDATTDEIEFIDSSLIFIDIPFDAWYKEAVDFAVLNGLMNGVGDGTRFDPNGSMTRAMVVTVLYRLEGSPVVNNATPFTDLKADWYKDAVAWAYKTGVVTGTSASTFSPDGNVTREQIATILYRYADYKGYNVSATADLTTFPDSANVNSWAKEAMQWANGVGLITGATQNGTTVLAPQGEASRAQVATILMRFCKM